jgi:hypothetical protein
MMFGRRLMTLLACASLAASATAQFASIESDKAKGDFFYKSFGTTVAVDGDVVVVGSPVENLNKGTVYVYRDTGGVLTLEQTLTDPTPVSNDLFGAAVAVSGDLIAVGSPGTGNGTFNDDGEAYVFRFDGTTWQVDLSLTGEPLGFGTDVDIDGDAMIVSYPDGDSGASNGGEISVFRYDASEWKPEVLLRGTVVNGFMGERLALEGDWVFGGTNKTALDVFHLDGGQWGKSETLAVDNESLDADGDLLVVGNTFSATIYRRSCGLMVEEANLADPHQWPSVFGDAVAVHDDAVLVGAWANTVDFGSQGAAYVFRHDGAAWPLEQMLVASDTHDDQWFGWSVAIAGDRLVVGARGDDETWVNSGAAYLFNAAPQTPRWQDLGSALAGDEAPELAVVGTLVGGEALMLSLGCAQSGGSAALFAGFSALDAPFKGGTLVPNPDVLIAGLSVNPEGKLALAASWPPGVPSGVSLYLQMWTTDAGAPVGLSATNAVLGTTP